jgi:MOSC domain-containing protein YiiM
MDGTSGVVVAVSAKASHGVAKPNRLLIRLIGGEGVEGDAHCGSTVQHRSRVARDPRQANLRQVHLIHVELLEALTAQGFDLTPGLMGENITTRGVDLLSLPTGARLRIGTDALVEVTGLRNPCVQLDRLRPGLMAACLERAPNGALIRKAGVMAIVLKGGEVMAGDPIGVDPPIGVGAPLQPV